MSTGLADVVLPELAALRMEIDEHHQHKDVYSHSLTVLDQAIALEEPRVAAPDLVLRLAALLHDIGKPATRRHEERGRVSFHHHEVVGAKLVRKRLQALKYSKEVVEQVSRLTFLHLRFHGYGSGGWTDSAVRRYVTDAGDLLPRLHALVRSDSTTRNKRRAAMLSATYDSLEQRISELSEAEDLARVRPDLDGNRIMELLEISPGPRRRCSVAVPQGAAAGARPGRPGDRRGRAPRLVALTLSALPRARGRQRSGPPRWSASSSWTGHGARRARPPARARSARRSGGRWRGSRTATTTSAGTLLPEAGSTRAAATRATTKVTLNRVS